MSEPTVLFDVPGPRARRRNALLTVISGLVTAAIVVIVLWRLYDKGQFAADQWRPFTRRDVWTGFLLKGLANTLKAAAVASVLALVFGAIFGLARLSDHRWISVPAATVVEFFRAMPLLILIFLAFFLPAAVSPIIADGPFGTFQRITVRYFFSIFGVSIDAGKVTVPAFAALVFGLVLYNGSVLAEVVRAGVLSIPRGQSEAAYALGLRKNAVMRLVLLPQAVTAMMPAIVSQMVVLLKDTALGFIIGFEDLTSNGYKLEPASYFNLLPAAFVCALIYIAVNLALGRLAHALERRSRRSPRSAGGPISAEGGGPPAPGVGAGLGPGVP